jgi:hypothetical protein
MAFHLEGNRAVWSVPAFVLALHLNKQVGETQPVPRGTVRMLYAATAAH